jgi:beta-glucosidase
MSIDPQGVLKKLSRQEKASLTTGAAWFKTEEIAHAGISQVVMSDGPHGLRLQTHESFGMEQSGKATCFPPAVGLGSSWDPELAVRVGVALGEECRKESVHLLLGPGINIKRSPLCGRNFEYFSEDPYVSATMGTAWINGLQSQGVGASLKHFAVNNQETLRMTTSANIDPRPLHEIYLRAFEYVIKHSDPWTVMCSYNRINGVYASQNEWLLNTMLRERWGYEGLVVSDWGAVVDRVEALRAGLDLEMPGPRETPKQVLAAIESGALDEVILDRSALRAIALAARAEAMAPLDAYDVEAHHALAREVATRCAVLLRNDGDLLPLDPATSQTIAVIGEFARTPRYQGGGSSRVHPNQIDNALDAITELAPNATVNFAAGFVINGGGEEGQRLHDEAVGLARDADVVLAFLGLSTYDESEGFDRKHANIQPEQVALLGDLLAVNKNVVLILSNGSMVTLSGWTDEVPTILEGWLLGEAGGSALAALIFGLANPSGRLTETIPMRFEDNPSYLSFPGDYDEARYAEGIFVGYRYYDAVDMPVHFPFGYGLSYSQFRYDNVVVKKDANEIVVTLDLKNTSQREGREVVQVYVGALNSRVARAKKELRAYQNVFVAAGDSVAVTLRIAREELAYFDPLINDWIVEGLEYRVSVGSSSRDIHFAADIAIEGDNFTPPLSMMSTVEQWYYHPKGGPALQAAVAKHPAGEGGRDFPEEGTEIFRMMAGMRLNQMFDFMRNGMSPDEITEMERQANS